MKRNQALIPLSHDHQHGLAISHELRQVSAEEAAVARDKFLAFWNVEGRHHFRIEEEVLLPAVAHALPPTHDAVLRVLSDHVEIRRRAADLGAAAVPPLGDLRALGDSLERHIRHEERVLFPLIEESLSGPELESLGASVERAERRRGDAGP